MHKISFAAGLARSGLRNVDHRVHMHEESHLQYVSHKPNKAQEIHG